MDRASIIRELIRRNATDFVSYFESTPQEHEAERIIAASIDGSSALSADRAVVEAMLPDTEDDGRPEASYALNTGAMVLSLIDYLKTGDDQHYHDAVTLFFDTVDLRIHEQLERAGIPLPTDEQVVRHPLQTQERRWFQSLEFAD
jgi:hypothetical protein